MNTYSVYPGLPHFQPAIFEALDLKSAVYESQINFISKLNEAKVSKESQTKEACGALGVFKLSKDLSEFTMANVFNGVGKQTETMVLFPNPGMEGISGTAGRGPGGLIIRFLTEQGQWDLPISNIPAFLFKDPKKVPEFLETQQNVSLSNCKEETCEWDFLSNNPESIHQIMFLMSDRGMPYSYRFMNGFACETYTLYNREQKRVFARFHFKSLQGLRNYQYESVEASGKQCWEFYRQDLLDAIKNLEFPKWRVEIQIMDETQSKQNRVNPFDPTKTWSHKEFPLLEVGVLELNRAPDSGCFFENHISCLPSKCIEGIKLSRADKKDYPTPASFQSESSKLLNDHNMECRWESIESQNDYFSQARHFYRNVLSDKDQETVKENIICSLRNVKGPGMTSILKRQLCHFLRVDVGLGIALCREFDIHIH